MRRQNQGKFKVRAFSENPEGAIPGCSLATTARTCCPMSVLPGHTPRGGDTSGRRRRQLPAVVSGKAKGFVGASIQSIRSRKAWVSDGWPELASTSQGVGQPASSTPLARYR